MKARVWLMMVAVVAIAAIFVPWDSVRGVEDGANADEAVIRAVVDKYYRGVVTADRALIEAAWDVDRGHMKHVQGSGAGESVNVTPISLAIDWWTRVKASTSSSKILALDIVEGKMASVKFEFVYDRLYYIEYLTLLKVSGNWKIVSKAYVSRKLDG